jgi:hypothetical protein
VRRGAKTAVGAGLLVLAVALVGGRVWSRLDGPPPFSRLEALVDFRDAVYYPVVAFLAGENPYDRAHMLAHHPVDGTLGLYSPLALVLHLPWGLLPYRGAELGFVAYSFGLTIVLAFAAWRVNGHRPDAALVLGLAALLVVTRPGHWNLFLGQVALEAGLATIAALWWARAWPWLAGMALAITTFKPTYGLPLLALMAARGDGRALVRGSFVAGVVTLAALAPLLMNVGIDGLVTALHGNYVARVTTPAMSAAQSLFRVDVVALVGRLLGRAPDLLVTLGLGAAVLAAAAVALRRIADRADQSGRLLALTIATLAILLCTYHQQYDCVLLAPLLLTALPLRPLRRAQLPAALATVPFVNYLASGGVQRATGVGDGTVLMLSSVNTIALLGAFALLVGQALRPRVAA